MSLVTSSEGSCLNSSQVHLLGSSTSPTIEKSHSSSGVRGVGPAERTGKPSSKYWPGGSVVSWPLRRPLKPLEKNPSAITFPPRSPTRTLALAKSRRSVMSRSRPSSRPETLPCPPVIVGGIVPRAHDIAIQEVLVQPHVLASQLSPPKVTQHAQGVVYFREPAVVARSRVVGPFPGQKPLPLLREVLDLLHDLTARHRFACLSGIAAGTDLPFERGRDRARLPAGMPRCRTCFAAGSRAVGAPDRHQECPASYRPATSRQFTTFQKTLMYSKRRCRYLR